MLKVQEMLQRCGEHVDKSKKVDETEASAATNAETGEGGEGTGGTSDQARNVDIFAMDDIAPETQPLLNAASGEAAEQVPSQAAAPESEDEEDYPEPYFGGRDQAVATIGIALIAMGEDVGAEMALRQFKHLVGFPDSIESSVDLRV